MAIVSAFAISAMTLTGTNPAFAQEPSDNSYENDAATAYQQLAEQVFNAENPDTAYNMLTASEKQSLERALIFDHTESISSAPVNIATGQTLSTSESESLLNTQEGDLLPAAKFSGCWARKSEYEGRSAINIRLFTVGHNVTVCVRRGRVRSVRVGDVWSQIHAPGWRNNRNPKSAAINAGWEGRGRTQFFFTLGTAGVDLQQAEPCIQTRLNANGTSYWKGTICPLT